MRDKKIYIALSLILSIFFVTSPIEASNKFRRRGDDRLQQVTENDVKAEIEFGKILAAKILGRYRLYDNKKANEYVNLVGQSLVRYCSRPELEFHFAIIDTDTINAFTAPGGYIFITTGSLKRMSNEAELAAVLAHEIAHVTEKHIVKELNIKGTDDSAVSTMSGMIKSMAGGGSLEVAFLELAERGAKMLFEEGIKREDEFQADRHGLLLASQVGYQPSALRHYLFVVKKARQGEKSGSIAKTHPQFNERIKRLVKIEKDNGLGSVRGKTLERRFKANIKI